MVNGSEQGFSGNDFFSHSTQDLNDIPFMLQIGFEKENLVNELFTHRTLSCVEILI